METTYLAFDLGASSGRALLGRLEGGRVELEEVDRFRTPLLEAGGHLLWDLDALWRELQLGLERARERAPGLRSLSVDSWAVDYVPLDAAGVPLRHPYSYRDPRVQGRLEAALQKVPASELYSRTGIQLLEINTLFQLIADLHEEPERVGQTALRLLIADYWLYRFSGRAAAERTMASTTQLVNIRSGTWDGELMRRLGIAAEGWPDIVPPGTVLGPLQAQGRAERHGPMVIAACSHDTASAVAAVPADEGGASWAYLSSGTWSLMGVERHEPVLTDAAREANFTNEAGLDGTVRFLKNLTGLWVLQECERAWRSSGERFTHETLIAEAEASPSSGRFVDLNDPRFAERGHMPAKLRTYCRARGLPEPQSRGALVRLILESLAESHRGALRQLEDVLGERIGVLHIVGGGARNALLCQWTADACGCRVLAGPAEATALGNLLVQARTMGDLPAGQTIRDVVRASCRLRTYEPRSARPTAASHAAHSK